MSHGSNPDACSLRILPLKAAGATSSLSELGSVDEAHAMVNLQRCCEDCCGISFGYRNVRLIISQKTTTWPVGLFLLATGQHLFRLLKHANK